MAALRRLRTIGLHAAATAAAPEADAVEIVRDGRRPVLSAGKVPRRCAATDREAIAAALQEDGVAVLVDLPGDADEGERYWESAAGMLPRLCFGEDGLIEGEPAVSAVHHEFARNKQMRELQAKSGELGVLHPAKRDEMLAQAERDGMPNYKTIPWKSDGGLALPHTDGYVYGDHVPDYIFLLMERQNEYGGESFFVDGEAVLQRLRAHPRADSLLPLLTTIPYDQTESSANGGFFQGRHSEGPLFDRRPDGRLRWKRMIGPKSRETDIPSSCWAVTEESLRAADSVGAEMTPEEVIQAVDEAILAEQQDAGRVRLGPNEAICIDNWRMLHSRESFGGEGERRLWRVWTWTTGSDGRPDGDGNPVSTPLDIHLALTAGQVGAVPTRDDDGS